MFWQNFITLCTKIGKSTTAVILEIGLSRSLVTSWKNGTVPNNTTLKKIADYFGISAEQLINDSPLEELKGHDEKDNEILNMYSRLSDEQKKQALSYLQYLAEHKAHEET